MIRRNLIHVSVRVKNHLTKPLLFSSNSQLKRGTVRCFTDKPNTNSTISSPPVQDVGSEQSPSMVEKKELLKAEIKVQKMSGNIFIPDELKESHWNELLGMNSLAKRKAFYKHLKVQELRKKKKKIQHQEEILQKLRQSDNCQHIQYGLGKNFILTSMSHQAAADYYNNNLSHAVLFGQDLVIDFDYVSCMSSIEQRQCFGRLLRLCAANRKDREPFHLHFCNVDPTHEMFQKLQNSVPVLQKQHSFIGVHEKSYLGLFPKNKLVYVTPYAEKDLVYNHDDIYILGGFVESGRTLPNASAKIKREGIRCSRLPMKRYLGINHRINNVRLNHLLNILLQMKNTGDWTKALEYVPKAQKT